MSTISQTPVAAAAAVQSVGKPGESKSNANKRKLHRLADTRLADDQKNIILPRITQAARIMEFQNKYHQSSQLYRLTSQLLCAKPEEDDSDGEDEVDSLALSSFFFFFFFFGFELCSPEGSSGIEPARW